MTGSVLSLNGHTRGPRANAALSFLGEASALSLEVEK